MARDTVRVGRSCWLPLTLLAPVLAGGAGCGLSAQPVRGFGSRQVLAVGDGQLNLLGFTMDESKLYLGRNLQVAGPVGLPPPYDLAALDLVSGGSDLIAPAVFRTRWLGAARAQGAGTVERVLAALHYPTAADVPATFTSINNPAPGRLGLALVNEATGVRLDIADVSDRNPVLFGPLASDPIAVDRFNAFGLPGVWYGRPEALRPAPPTVAKVVGFDGEDAFALTGPAAPSLEPALLRLNPAGLIAGVVVPSRLGEHLVLPDVDGALVPADAAALGPARPWYGCLHAAGAEPAASRCAFVYVRPGSNGAPGRLFARAPGDTQELVLPGLLDEIDATPHPAGVLWTASFGSGRRLYSWSLGAEAVSGCDVPAGTIRLVTWTSARDGFVAYVAASDLDGRQISSALVLGVPDGPCRVVSPQGARPTIWTFSADGSILAWHQAVPGGGTTIHLADTDLSGERRVELPVQAASSQFKGNDRLLIRRLSADGFGLSLLHLAEDPVREQVIADRIASSSPWVWLDDAWLLLGDDLSRQDDTFNLRVVNTQTGASRLISTSVTSFVTPPTVPHLDTAPVSLGYIVRGRTPSTQDGIWTALLERKDLL